MAKLSENIRHHRFGCLGKQASECHPASYQVVARVISRLSSTQPMRGHHLKGLSINIATCTCCYRNFPWDNLDYRAC